MGQILICDICTLVIKDNEKKYKFLLQEDTNVNGAEDIEEMSKRYNESYRSIEVKELCGKCKKILDYLFNIRKDKMQKILREIEKSYKPEKYCQCANYEDRGLVVYGKADGVCYICGKKEKGENPLSAEELKKLIEKEEREKDER